jgi:hypothetical protein
VLKKVAESQFAGDLKSCFAARYNGVAASDVTREES